MINRPNLAYPHAGIIVFAKAPLPGGVKTRLAAAIGDTEAAGVYEQLVRDTVGTAVQAELAPIQLQVVADSSHPFFRSLADEFALEVCLQEGKDLGQRMHHAIQQALQECDFAVLIGTDCPVITPDYLRQACTALHAGTDVVLGPAEDGGYVLIGMRRSEERLFTDIPWSTSRVRAITQERLRSIPLQYRELDVLWDLDTVEDYHRWLKLNTLSH